MAANELIKKYEEIVPEGMDASELCDFYYSVLNGNIKHEDALRDMHKEGTNFDG